ncbi:LysR family transcriptional regulator [Labrys miyagiensis]|uniref:LysR family transcriptional regulator n=1 Tax=Labrys miyagiensis TaxID=346912 RepID=A0ABQ6CE77_9HYPH|nr:LysR family transcriptional regulator [Labrys miyagiensis]
MLKLPPLNSLRAFEAVARLGSVSRAGDELCVTHSAVSHQLKVLEQWIGKPLFLRNARGITLTAEGQALGLTLTPCFTAIAERVDTLMTHVSKPTITVGCIPSIAARWLVPNLAQFSEMHPDIELNVQYARASQKLPLGDLDVLITLGRDEAAQVKNTAIFSRANKPVTSPAYLTRFGPIAGPADIARADLLHDEGKSGWEEWFRKAGAPAPFPLNGAVFQDFNLLATAVIAGHGVALCPTEVFREELKRGDLVILSDIATLVDQHYFIITRIPPAEPVVLFSDWFRALTAPAQ